MLGWLWSVILQSSPCSVRGGDRGSVGSPLNLPPIFCHAQNPRSLGGDVASDGDFLIFEGNRYSRKGFLFKSFAMSAVITEGVKPTLSELEKFEDQPEGIDLEVVTESTGICSHL